MSSYDDMSTLECDVGIETNEDGLWECARCNWVCPVATEEPPRNNCPEGQSPEAKAAAEQGIAEAAERLGIEANYIKHWAQALLRWSLAGFPTRSPDETEQIEREHCQPCKHYVEDGARCRKCGCRVNNNWLPVINKIRMATESCPVGKWGDLASGRKPRVDQDPADG